MKTKKLYRVQISIDVMVKAHEETEALSIAQEQVGYEAARPANQKCSEVLGPDDVSRGWQGSSNPTAAYERPPFDDPAWSIEDYLRALRG